MNENCSHKNLYVNVYSSPIHNCCKLDTAHMYPLGSLFIQGNTIHQLKEKKS